MLKSWATSRGPLRTSACESRRGAGEIGWQIGIDRGDGFAQGRPERFRRLAGMRADNDGAELRRRTGAEQRHIEAGAIGLAIKWPLHQRVGHNADDGAPRLRLRRIENPDLMSERALVAPIFARKTRIHDRDRLFRVAVFEGEIAPLENLQTRAC